MRSSSPLRLVATMLLLAVAVPARADEAPTLAHLRGKVFERGSSTPLVSAEITTSTGEQVETDDNGAFSIDLAPGKIQIAITEPHHQPLKVEETLGPRETVEVEYRLMPLPSWRRHRYQSVVTAGEPRHEGARFTLKDEELHNAPGTLGDPFRVIGLLPGVTQPVPFLPLYTIRGDSPGMNGFFLDGMRVPQLFHFLAGGGVVHAQLVDRLDFYPGTYDASFGHYAGGIIDATTRTANTDAPAHGQLELRFYDVSALAETHVGDLKVIAAGHYGWPGAFLSALTATGLISTQVGLSYWDYQLRADWHGFTLEALGSYDDLAVTQGGVANDVRLEFHRVQLRWRARKGRASLEAAIVGGYDETLAASAEGISKLGLSGRVIARARFGRDFIVSGGLYGELSQFSPEGFSSLTTRAVPDELGELAFSRAGIVGSAWAQAEDDLFERLHVTLGVRADAYHAGLVTLLGIDPRTTWRMKLLDNLTLTGGFGLYQQPPSFPVPLPGLDTYALQLGLQSAWQGSSGVEARLPWGIFASATGFYDKFHNINDVLLDFQPTTCSTPAPESLTGVPARITKQVDGDSFGMELLARKQEGRVTGWLAYTISRSERVYACGLAPSDFDQNHVLNLVVQARLAWNVMVSGRFYLATGRPYTQIPTNLGPQDTPPRNNQRLPTYAQLDLRLDREWLYDKWALSLFVDVLNAIYSETVFNVTYPSVNGIPQYDQPQLNGIRWVLPSLGVRGRF